MPKKQAIQNDSAAAQPARTVKPRAPRVKTAAHHKAAPVETVGESISEAVAPAVSVATPQVSAASRDEAIALMAYGYWEERGRQGGSPEEDWLRAEKEYLLARG